MRGFALRGLPGLRYCVTARLPPTSERWMVDCCHLRESDRDDSTLLSAQTPRASGSSSRRWTGARTRPRIGSQKLRFVAHSA